VLELPDEHLADSPQIERTDERTALLVEDVERLADAPVVARPEENRVLGGGLVVYPVLAERGIEPLRDAL
jgi:hypothetical protein